MLNIFSKLACLLKREQGQLNMYMSAKEIVVN